MKAFATLFCTIALPMTVFAQNPKGIGGMDMEKMMQQAQKIQACMQQVDQAELEKFQQHAEEVNNELKSLCADGKRKKAQKLAIKFSKEAGKNQAIQEMKKCGEMAQDMMPQMQPPQDEYDKDYSKQHVCDTIE